MHSMERNFKVAILLVPLLVGLGFAGGHAQVLPKSKNGIVVLSGPFRFGQRLLPAGIFEFHCIHKGRSHIMAVYRVTLSPPPKGEAGKPVAVAYCRMEPLREKVKVTHVDTARDKAGNWVVNEIRIQDEQVRHIFGASPEVNRT